MRWLLLLILSIVLLPTATALDIFGEFGEAITGWQIIISPDSPEAAKLSGEGNTKFPMMN